MSDGHEIDESMPLEEVAALVCTTLENHGISVVLSGGAVVSIYSDAEYVSYDLDFIPIGLARKVDGAMESLGFVKQQRHWRIRRVDTGSSFQSALPLSGKKRSTSSPSAGARPVCCVSFDPRNA